MSNQVRTASGAAVVLAAYFTGLIAAIVHGHQSLDAEHIAALAVFFLFIAVCAFVTTLNLQKIIDRRRS